MAFHGRVAVVTGGGSGMGQIFARRMADSGAKVAVLDVNEAGLEATTAGRPNITAHTCDVSNEQRVNDVIAKVTRDAGPIDRLVHAAALMPTSPVLDEAPERIKQLMRVNYDGTVNMVGAVLPGMVRRGSGDFVVFSSVAAHALAPHMGAYCASKAAVNALVEVLIYENAGSGVRIHLTCPPMTNTPLLDQPQATSNPKSIQRGFEKNLVADPEAVVDAIETALEKGKSMSFPGAMAKGLYGMRRLSPKLLWKIILKEEQRP